MIYSIIVVEKLQFCNIQLSENCTLGTLTTQGNYQGIPASCCCCASRTNTNIADSVLVTSLTTDGARWRSL